MLHCPVICKPCVIPRQCMSSGMWHAQACCMCTAPAEQSSVCHYMGSGAGAAESCTESDPAPLACRSSCWTRRGTCVEGAVGRSGWRTSSGTVSWTRGGTWGGSSRYGFLDHPTTWALRHTSIQASACQWQERVRHVGLHAHAQTPHGTLPSAGTCRFLVLVFCFLSPQSIQELILLCTPLREVLPCPSRPSRRCGCGTHVSLMLPALVTLRGC